MSRIASGGVTLEFAGRLVLSRILRVGRFMYVMSADAEAETHRHDEEFARVRL